MIDLANEFLGYLTDRNYSRQTARAYAFDLLHFLRWLSVDGLALEDVGTDALLRYLTACRTTVLPHQQGGNVYSIRDGRSTGYAARTINRRLAALSALFSFRSLRDPAAINPVSRGREAQQATRAERAGLLGHLARPAPRSRLWVREPRRLPRGLNPSETAALLGSFGTVRDQAIAGLMLFSGLRSCELLALAVQDVDIARRVGAGARQGREGTSGPGRPRGRCADPVLPSH